MIPTSSDDDDDDDEFDDDDDDDEFDDDVDVHDDDDEEDDEEEEDEDFKKFDYLYDYESSSSFALTPITTNSSSNIISGLEKPYYFPFEKGQKGRLIKKHLNPKKKRQKLNLNNCVNIYAKKMSCPVNEILSKVHNYITFKNFNNLNAADAVVWSVIRESLYKVPVRVIHKLFGIGSHKYKRLLDSRLKRKKPGGLNGLQVLVQLRHFYTTQIN